MLERKIKNLLVCGGLILGLNNCVSGYNSTTNRQRNQGEVFQCKEKRRAEIIVADECSYYDGVVFETDYGPDGPHNGNDQRTFFLYFREGVSMRPGTQGWGNGINKRAVCSGYGNCDPNGDCDSRRQLSEEERSSQASNFGESGFQKGVQLFLSGRGQQETPEYNCEMLEKYGL